MNIEKKRKKIYNNAQGEEEYNVGCVGFEHKAFPTLHSETNHDLVRSGTLWEGCILIEY